MNLLYPLQYVFMYTRTYVGKTLDRSLVNSCLLASKLSIVIFKMLNKSMYYVITPSACPPYLTWLDQAIYGTW